MADRPTALPVFDARVDDQVRMIREQHGWWPCRSGCDGCCRSLGALPHATSAEWTRVEAEIAGLAPATRAQIGARLDALHAQQGARPLVCPLLDVEAGLCLVYEARPLACRTYGYYVSRGDGRWCRIIEDELARRPVEASEVVYGNLDALEAEVCASHGETVSLLLWWSERGACVAGGPSG